MLLFPPIFLALPNETNLLNSIPKIRVLILFPKPCVFLFAYDSNVGQFCAACFFEVFVHVYPVMRKKYVLR